VSHIVTYLTHQSLIDKRLISSQCNSNVDLNFIEIYKECIKWSFWSRWSQDNDKRIKQNKICILLCTQNVINCDCCWFNFLIIVKKI